MTGQFVHVPEKSAPDERKKRRVEKAAHELALAAMAYAKTVEFEIPSEVDLEEGEEKFLNMMAQSHAIKTMVLAAKYAAHKQGYFTQEANLNCVLHEIGAAFDDLFMTDRLPIEFRKEVAQVWVGSIQQMLEMKTGMFDDFGSVQ